MRALRVGIQLPEVERRVPFAELLHLARAAEQVGFDAIWLGDHLLYDLPEGPRGPWEVWTSLAALAAGTERIRLGPLVACTGFHAPAMLAKFAATVDAISDGRLVLGLGAGWNQREYRAFGFAYDRRVSRFAESFTIIRELLRNGSSDFAGRFHQVEGCVLDPPPVGLVPIMVGSVAPRMLAITLPFVEAWNVWWAEYANTPAGFAAVRQRVRTATAAVGRDPDQVAATCAVLIRLPGGRGRVMGHPDLGAPIRGSATEIADQLKAFAAVGAAEVQLVVDPITLDSVEALGAVLADLDAC